MTITVSSGVTSSGLQVSAGDPVVVLSGGVIAGAFILDNATVTLSSGAIADWLEIDSGGTLDGSGTLEGNVTDFGTISGVTIVRDSITPNQGIITEVEVYGSAVDVVVDADAWITIVNSATATGNTIKAGGIEYVFGAATDTLVSSGGILGLAGGGNASGSNIENGGEFIIAGETLTSNITLGSETSTTVIDGVTISSGGYFSLSEDTVASGVTVSLGASAQANALFISSGGLLSGPGALRGSTSVAGTINGATVGVETTGPDPGDYLTGDLQLLSGGVANSVTIVNISEMDIDAGGRDARAVINNGCVESVDGGSATGDQILSGGTLIFESGTVTSDTVSKGGTLELTGNVSGNLTIISGAENQTTILDGVTISSGGYLSLVDATLRSGATVSLAKGAIISDLVVSNGATLFGQGEIGSKATIEGLISGVTVSGSFYSGLNIVSGGQAENVVVDEGTRLFVSRGGSTTGTLLAGAEWVCSGGAASGTVVRSGAEEAVLVAGAAIGTIVSNGGEQMVSGVASGTALLGGAIEINEGLIVGAIVSSGASVSNYSSASGTIVLKGGVLNDYMGTAVGTLVSAGGVVTEHSLAMDVRISSGGLQIVDGHYSITRVSGKSLDAIIFDGGLQRIVSGGQSTGTIISSGGRSLVSSGTAYETVILTGGVETVYNQARSNTVKGGREIVSSGASDTRTTVLDGGTLYLMTGAASYAAEIGDGGHELMSSGARAASTTVLAGGVLYVYSGGVTTSSNVSGGHELVAGGSASWEKVWSRGSIYVLSKGQTGNSQLAYDAHEFASAGGIASNTVVNSGGAQHVLSGGVAKNTLVSSGGAEYVSSGGVSSDTIVLSGGKEIVEAGGIAIGLFTSATFPSDGPEVIDNGLVQITASNGLIGALKGNGQIDQVGGGQALLEDDGAGFAGTLVISGGAADLVTANALGRGSVVFVEPSTRSSILQVGSANAPTANGTFANTLSNFNGVKESVALQSIDYASGAFATVSGSVLVLSDGGSTYKFKLAGAVDASGYSVVDKGYNGVMIVPKAAAMAQAMAAMAPDAVGLASATRSTSASATPLLAAGVTASGAGLHG